MRKRIARSIVTVTAVIIVVLGVPLAVVVQRFYESRTIVALQHAAQLTVAELTVPLRVDEIAAAAAEPDTPARFSVYDGDGALLYGDGPDTLSEPDPDLLTVVVPVTDRSTEDRVGWVVVTQPRRVIAAETAEAWLLMALAALAGLALAVVIARREATRLATPIADLAGRAEHIGTGAFAAGVADSGIAEIDTLSHALTASDHRLAEVLARERQFSANASHQLRTPLAALRIDLERGDLDAAAVQVDRLEDTVEHLLALARNALGEPTAIDVAALVDQARQRWLPAFERADRTLTLTHSGTRTLTQPLTPAGPPTLDGTIPAARARAGSLDQALDIIVDNALRHGGGETRLGIHRAPGGVVVSVDDDGPGIPAADGDAVFRRHRGHDNGIGLALARTLIEADGGRLVLADPERAEFRIVLLACGSSTVTENGHT